MGVEDTGEHVALLVFMIYNDIVSKVSFVVDKDVSGGGGVWGVALFIHAVVIDDGARQR